MQRGIIFATILLYIIIFAGILLSFLVNIFLVPISFTPKSILQEILNVMNLKPSDKLYDLGSGDSRLLNLASKTEFIKATGYEISPILTYISKFVSRFSGKRKGVLNVVTGSFFNADLNQATHIYCYLNEKALKALTPKFKKELNQNAKVYCYKFKIPGFKPSETKILTNSEKLYIYTLKELKGA